MSARFAFEDVADYVIVGTGAGGATAARVLSEAGFSLVLLEEGPALATEERARGLLDALSQSMRDLGTLSTRGPTPLPLLQGRCVGGSTAINSGIIWRLPESVRRDFADRFGLGELVQSRELDRIFETMERELEVAPVDARIRGGNAHLMEKACEQLGLPGRPMNRNARRCQGSARCLQGCPNAARQSMDVSYVPFAQARGARLHALARATKIVAREGRAHAVEGELLTTDRRVRGRFRVVARRGIVIAAGAIHTPVLLRKSGLRRLVGDRFQAHPGAAVIGRFPETVGMGFGATQSYEVPLPEQNLKLESLALPPELLAARLPGAGEDWQRRLHHLDTYAQWACIVRMQALGRVRESRFGGVAVHYEPLREDMWRIQQGVALLVRMLFAAGAQEVYPGVARLPEVFTNPDQAELILGSGVRRHDFHLMASHHFGTACAHADAGRGVVGPTLECHDLSRLFVMDASVFPTNLGVNPQHSIMALAFRASEWLANETRSGKAAA